MKTQLLKEILFSLAITMAIFIKAGAQDIKLSQESKERPISKAMGNDVLYDQTSQPVSFGIASQDFPDFPTYSCQAADDFVIPDGETWMIETIQVNGFYSLDGGPAQMVNLALMLNQPEMNAPGNPLIWIPGLPVESDTIGNLQLNFFSNPITLPGGHYWLSIQPMMSFTDFGQWFWGKQAAPTLLNEFHWQNPGGGWNLPNTFTWQKASLINWGSASTDWNLDFALFGTVMGQTNHDFSLVVGDYHNPEPWHDWIGGGENTRLQVITDGQSTDVSGVDFFYSLDGVEWNLFYHDSDGTILAENTTTPSPQGDGWTGYLPNNLIPQQDLMLTFKAEVTFPDGTTAEQTRNIRFDPTPPSGIQINIEDFMIIQDNTILLEIEPGTCSDLSYCEVELVTKPEYFNKGVPHITQPTGTTCAPTAAAACLKWFGGAVTGGLTDDELVEALKEACKTDQGKSGTNPDDLAKGLRDWIAAHGDGYTVRGPLPFDWKQMRNELERGQDVLSGIVWTGGGGHRMTFNSIKNTPEPDGKIRIDFMDPWTGKEEWGYVDPATGELTGFTGAGASGTLGNIIIICPKETSPTPGTGTILPGPNPPAITIPVPSPGLYFLRINAVDNSGNVSRIDLVINNPSEQPEIHSINDDVTHLGESVRIYGIGFGQPGISSNLLIDGIMYPFTYWSDNEVYFTCPMLDPSYPHIIQLLRSDGMLSNPFTFTVSQPSEVYFISPNENERITDGQLQIKVAIPVFRENINEVQFFFKPSDSNQCNYLGSDFDGTDVSFGTINNIGTGDGWSYYWNFGTLPDMNYDIQVVAFDNVGNTYTGFREIQIDFNPPGLLINEDNSKLAGGLTVPEDFIELEVEVDEEETTDINIWIKLLGGFDFVRVLKHIRQDTVIVKDKNGDTISEWICGPVAAAVCLDWLKNQKQGMSSDDNITDLIKKLAEKSGTEKDRGTSDDDLEKAIKETAKEDPNIPDDIKTERHVDDGYKHIGKELRDSSDVIILIQQPYNDTIEGDVDTVGHYVTVSSHHSTIVYQPGPEGSGIMCMAVEKQYIDFMDPGSGETEYREVEWWQKPPVIKDYDLVDPKVKAGEAKVGSTIIVKIPPKKNPSRKYELVYQATIPTNGQGIYHISIPCSDLPAGVLLAEIQTNGSKAELASDFVLLTNGNATPFAAFDASEKNGIAPFSVQFSDLSLPPDSIKSWNWDFGDGEESVLQNPLHTYQNPGVYSVTLVVSDGSVADTLIKTNLITVSVPVCQTLALREGWSGISSYIESSVKDIPVMFAPVADDLVILYNFNSVFYPSGGIIPDEPWDSQSGYVIKMLNDATVAICGSLIESPFVKLKAGWNIMPVTSAGYVDVAMTFGSVPQVSIAKEVAGQGIYWKMYGINSLVWMIPGQSYFVYSTGDVDVLLQGSSTSTKSLRMHESGTFSPWNKVVTTAESHIIAFPATVVSGFQKGDVIGVFNSLGRCCGYAEFTGNPFGLTAFGKDFQLSPSDGFVQNEAFTFKLFRIATNEYFSLEIRFNPGLTYQGKYFPHGISQIESAVLLPTSANAPLNELTFELFPNPANETINIFTNVSDAVVIIMNSQGDVVIKSEVKGNQLDVSSLKPGIYFVRVINSNTLIVKKLMIE